MVTVYGIKNCSTVKKALNWLAEHKIETKLHDYRVDGIDENFLKRAEQAFGWQTMLNKRSATWRNLADEDKNNISKESALALMQANPTLIKRPIILTDNIALIGFKDADYQQAFNKK